MITQEARELLEQLLTRVNRLEQRPSIPSGWRFEDRDAGTWGSAGIYAVGPNGSSTFLGVR